MDYQEEMKQALIGTLSVGNKDDAERIARMVEAVVQSGVDQYEFADALKSAPADKVEELAWVVNDLYNYNPKTAWEVVRLTPNILYQTGDIQPVIEFLNAIEHSRALWTFLGADPVLAAEAVRLIPDILELSNGDLKTVEDLSMVMCKGVFRTDEGLRTDMYYATHDLDSYEAAQVIVGLCNLGSQKDYWFGSQEKLSDYASAYKEAYKDGKAEAFVNNLRAALAAEAPSKDVINEAYAMAMTTEPVKKWSPTDDKEKPVKNKNGEER